MEPIGTLCMEVPPTFGILRLKKIFIVKFLQIFPVAKINYRVSHINIRYRVSHINIRYRVSHINIRSFIALNSDLRD